MSKKITTADFILAARKTHGDKFNYDEAVYTKAKNNVKILCLTCNKYFYQQAKHHTNGSGCRYCAFIQLGIRSSSNRNEFITKAKSIHGDKYDYTSVIYRGNAIKVDIICPTHGAFKQRPNNHLSGQGCPKCGGHIGIDNDMFIARARQVHGDRYDYSKINYTSTENKVIIGCRKHGDFTQIPSAHWIGQGCPKCGKESMAAAQANTKEYFITEANKVHSNKYNYTKVVYVYNKEPVIIGCPLHGDFKQTPNSHLRGGGCPICNESRGERKIRNYLVEHQIEYKREYRIQPYMFRYDFYLPKLNILVEFHGIQHYKPVTAFGGEEQFIVQQQRDHDKRLLAIANNIPLIEIKYNVNDPGDYLTHKISELYKYRVEHKFYRNFLDLCKDLELPITTKPKDVKQHLTYKK